MQNALMVILFLLIAFVLMSFAPKRDYSHVPKEYRHLVRFAEGAGY